LDASKRQQVRDYRTARRALEAAAAQPPAADGEEMDEEDDAIAHPPVAGDVETGEEDDADEEFSSLSSEDDDEEKADKDEDGDGSMPGAAEEVRSAADECKEEDGLEDGEEETKKMEGDDAPLDMPVGAQEADYSPESPSREPFPEKEDEDQEPVMEIETDDAAFYSFWTEEFVVKETGLALVSKTCAEEELRKKDELLKKALQERSDSARHEKRSRGVLEEVLRVEKKVRENAEKKNASLIDAMSVLEQRLAAKEDANQKLVSLRKAAEKKLADEKNKEDSAAE